MIDILSPWSSTSVDEAALILGVRRDDIRALRKKVAWTLGSQGINEEHPIPAEFTGAVEWMIRKIVEAGNDPRWPHCLTIPRFPYLPLAAQYLEDHPDASLDDTSTGCLTMLLQPRKEDQRDIDDVKTTLGAQYNHRSFTWGLPFVFAPEEDTESGPQIDLLPPSAPTVPIPPAWRPGIGILPAPATISESDACGLTPLEDEITGTRDYRLTHAAILPGQYLGLTYRAKEDQPIPEQLRIFFSGQLDGQTWRRAAEDERKIDETIRDLEHHPERYSSLKSMPFTIMLDPLMTPVAVIKYIGRGGYVRSIGVKSILGIDGLIVHPSIIPQVSPLLKLVAKSMDSTGVHGSLFIPGWLHALTPSFFPGFRRVISPSAGTAVEIARNYGPGTATREIASSHGSDAVNYARLVDHGPHEVTARGSLAYASDTIRYGEDVPGASTSAQIRKIIIDGLRGKTGNTILTWAADIDGGPSDDTRTAVTSLDGPERMAYSFLYAAKIDKGPHPSTRLACLQDPYTAYLYDMWILGTDTEDGRAAACCDHRVALFYAQDIDKAPSTTTLTGVTRSGHTEQTWKILKNCSRPGTGTTSLDPEWRRYGRHEYHGVINKGFDILEYSFEVINGPNEEVERGLMSQDNCGPWSLVKYLLRFTDRIDNRSLMALATPLGIQACESAETPDEGDMDGIELMTAVVSTRARRAKVIAEDREGKATWLIAKLVDGKKRKDTYEKIVSLCSNATRQSSSWTNSGIRSYYDEFIYPEIPSIEIRYAFSLSGIDPSRRWSSATYHDGSWENPSRDYVDKIEKKIGQYATGISFAAQQIGTQDSRAAKALDKLSQNITNQGWMGVRNALEECLELDRAKKFLMESGIDKALTWLTQPPIMYESGNNDNTHKPLGSTILKSKSVPYSLYVSLVGSRGRYNAPDIGFQSVFGDHAENEESATLRKVCGISSDHQLSTVRGEIEEWLEGLDNRQRSYIRRRLEIEKGGDYIGNLTVLWGAATLQDAAMWSPSPFVMKISVESTPYLNAFRHSPDGNCAGWLLVYPAKWSQVNETARPTIFWK